MQKRRITPAAKTLLIVLLCCCCALLAACTPPSGQASDVGSGSGETEVKTIYITTGDKTERIQLADTEAAAALTYRLAEGDVTVSADDYGGFEKVGGLGFSLPQGDERLTAQAGDVMLYMGNQIVFFYGGNSYSYTRLGYIAGLSPQHLREFLCAGEGKVHITLSLHRP